jgi:hypothetical protein
LCRKPRKNEVSPPNVGILSNHVGIFASSRPHLCIVTIDYPNKQKIVIMQKNLAQQEVQVTENRTQEGIICFACLTFFPLVYLIGKTVISLI